MGYDFDKNIDGGNVCSTCPKGCCSYCAKNFGYFGHVQDENPNVPLELILLGLFISDAMILNSGQEWKFNSILQNKGAIRAISEAEKKLGYKITFSKKTGFLTENGCSLKREHRSKICTSYACGTLQKAIKLNLIHKTFSDVHTTKD